MKLPDEETIDGIKRLFALHVPDSLDKRNILESLSINIFIPPSSKCPKCKEVLVCPDCDDINISLDATVHINGRTVYV